MIETSVAAALARLNGLSGSVSRDLPKKVEWIQKELASIQCLLEDAAFKSANGDEDAKQWVKEVKEVCYQIEDVVDDVEQVEEAQRRREGNFFKKFVDMPGEMMVVREILSRADGIMSTIKEILEAGKRYDSKPLEEVKNEENNGSFVNMPGETEVIGFESQFKQVMGLLTDQEKKDRTFIVLVGMDGIGKTTLAKKGLQFEGNQRVFRDIGLGVAPHKCETADVLKSVLKGLLGVSQKSYNNTSEITASNIEKMKEKEMVEKIQELLKSRKYMIVLDDISNKEAWNRIQQILPNSGNGSRIIVTTTQNLEMVKPEGEQPFTHTIELPLLSDEDSWELLKSNVFRVSSDDDNQSMIEELEPIGRSLVNSCRGFPLALVLLSGLLSKNLNYKSWSDIADAIRREPMLSDQKFCKNILSLHQNYLPNTFVRSCFHYISSYPKNFPVSTSKLFKLWIAEGLVPYNKDRTFEQTAHEYLVTLIERRMLQVVQRAGSRDV